MSRRLSASVLAIRKPISRTIFAGYAKLQLDANEEAVARFRARLSSTEIIHARISGSPPH